MCNKYKYTMNTCRGEEETSEVEACRDIAYRSRTRHSKRLRVNATPQNFIRLNMRLIEQHSVLTSVALVT